jgi:hypothetical protein
MCLGGKERLLANFASDSSNLQTHPRPHKWKVYALLCFLLFENYVWPHWHIGYEGLEDPGRKSTNGGSPSCTTAMEVMVGEVVGTNLEASSSTNYKFWTH